MAGVQVRSLTKSFGDTAVVRNLDLDVEHGEFLTLLGPSGCGKSTFLRIVAGLETQTSGSVIIDNKVVDTVRPKLRDAAMVFQSYALYPYMTVAQNMALPLTMRRLKAWQRLPLLGRFLPGSRQARACIEADVDVVAETLGIAHLLHRKPNQLSGGQRQRVALGRAMVRNPKVFLMDEPLSNLDAKLRVQTRAEITDLHRRLGTTFIYVTHDQAEAMTMSDRVAVMMDGELLQVASPQAIYNDPADLRVATFIGSPRINCLAGVVSGNNTIDTSGAKVPFVSGLTLGTPVTLGLRPEALTIVEKDGPGTLTGRVRTVEHLGSDLFVHLDLPENKDVLIVRTAPDRNCEIQRDLSIHVTPVESGMLLFDSEGRRLRSQADRTPALRSVSQP